MNSEITFRSYSKNDRHICLSIFDENCPKYFAPNERSDFERFLEQAPCGYELCILNGAIVGAYGLIGSGSINQSLNWILLSARAQGIGLGSVIMSRVIDTASQKGLSTIDIAASHLSRDFFAKYGAITVSSKNDG